MGKYCLHLSIFLFILYTFSSSSVLQAQTTPPPPTPSRSYYISHEGMSPNELQSQGCQLGHRVKWSGEPLIFSTLLFGSPEKQEEAFGVRVFGHMPTFYNLAEIEEATFFFAFGYYFCTLDLPSAPWLKLGVGINNNMTNGVNYVQRDHGEFWSRELMAPLNDRLAQLTPRILAVGAFDAEPEWNDPQSTRNWVNGYLYAFNTPPKTLYFVGTAGGCLEPPPPPQDDPERLGSWCGTAQYPEWYMRDIARITMHQRIKVIPQIYTPSGFNAYQWYLMALFNYNAPINLDFRGVLTTETACLQYASDPLCASGDINNSPADGWNQLWAALSQDPYTILLTQNLTFSTDMEWQMGPDVP